MTDQEFTACAKRYLDMVYRIALNWFGPPQRADAEDAAQNTMLRLYRTDTAFESEDHLRYWLARVTLNECTRLSSSLWRLRTVPLDACPEPVFSDPGRQTLFQEVMSLPGKYRVPLYLYYYEGYSVEEVGQLMGLKPSTVQTRLARGREKLKKILMEE